MLNPNVSYKAPPASVLGLACSLRRSRLQIFEFQTQTDKTRKHDTTCFNPQSLGRWNTKTLHKKWEMIYEGMSDLWALRHMEQMEGQSSWPQIAKAEPHSDQIICDWWKDAGSLKLMRPLNQGIQSDTKTIHTDHLQRFLERPQIPHKYRRCHGQIAP